jgi:tetratricopeptide (TPR) repeat protein
MVGITLENLVAKDLIPRTVVAKKMDAPFVDSTILELSLKNDEGYAILGRIPDGADIPAEIKESGFGESPSDYYVVLRSSPIRPSEQDIKQAEASLRAFHQRPALFSEWIHQGHTPTIVGDFRGARDLGTYVTTQETPIRLNADDEAPGTKPVGEVYIAGIDSRGLGDDGVALQGEQHRLLESLKRTDDPELALLEALAESGSDKGVAIVRILRAERNIAQKEYREARKEARKALENDPENVDGYLALAKGFYGSRMDTHVKKSIEEGMGQSNNQELYSFLNGKIVNNYGAGVRDVRAGKYVNARKQLRRVVALQSGTIDEATEKHTRALKAQFWVAESYLREGKQSDARVAFRKMLSLPEINDGEYNHAQVHYKLGLSLLEDGKEEAAKRAFSAAVGLDPKHEAKIYLT